MKFNLHQTRTLNHAGAPSYRLSAELELYTVVVNSLIADTFYEKTDTRLARIQALIQQVDPLFVAKLAVYAREQMHLRSVPLVLTTELAKIHQGDDLVGRTTARVVQRADEITELLAYYQLANARHGTKKLNRLSKQIQKGLAEAFNRFDEYQFAKYNRSHTDIKLRDALFLVHPKANTEAQQGIFDRIANDTLAIPYTWETALSAVGHEAHASAQAKQAAKAQAWESLILNGKLGYMAMLRNLRNIVEANVSQVAFDQVCATLSDARAVAQAKQMPFRFLSAYRELTQLNSGRVGQLLTALEQAALHTASNIRGFEAHTKVVIAADVSGSMQQPISPNSTVQYFDIGLMLAMLLQSRCKNVVTGMFGDTWKIINVPKQNILANVSTFHRREGEVGYSTNGHLVIRDLVDRRCVVDKVMLFTDCQLWTRANGGSLAATWRQYRAIAPEARLYLFDLAGYGHAPVQVLHNESVCLIAGWSDRVFDVMTALEGGDSALGQIKELCI